MKDLNDFVTDSTLTAADFVIPMSEVQNVVEDTGQTLSAGDLNQLGKGIANYVANGTFTTDSGAADAYVLTEIGSKQSPTAYTDGMNINFVSGNDNTGASTVNAYGLGVKNIKLSGGANPAAGDISGRTELVYDSGNGWFELMNPKVTDALQLATAWVVFDGTGTAAILDSYNISGIVDNGVGDYSLTFSNTTSSSNYVTVGYSERPGGVVFGVPVRSAYFRNRATSGFDILTSSADTSAQTVAEDSDYVCALIFGGQ